jgi:hypothetical protein
LDPNFQHIWLFSFEKICKTQAQQTGIPWTSKMDMIGLTHGFKYLKHVGWNIENCF